MENRKEIQDRINKNIRLIGYKVFYRSGCYKFTNAYDKLVSRVSLDWDMNINELLSNKRVSVDKYVSMFDVLSDYELKLTLKSSQNLLELYKDVIVA